MLMKIDEYLDEIYQNREEDPQLSMSSCWYNTAHLLKGATLLLSEQAKSVYGINDFAISLDFQSNFRFQTFLEDAHTLLVQSTTTRLWFDVKQKGKKSKSKANHEVQVTAQLRVESYEIEIGTTAMDSQKFMELLNANNNANSVLERLITLPSPPPLFENREENMLDMVSTRWLDNIKLKCHWWNGNTVPLRLFLHTLFEQFYFLWHSIIAVIISIVFYQVDNQFSELSGEEYQSVVDVIRNNQNEDFGYENKEFMSWRQIKLPFFL